MSLKIELTQKRLQELGLYNNVIDGIKGRATISAIKRFQRRKGLQDSGLLDEKTYKKLFNINPAEPKIASRVPEYSDDIPWLEEAQRLMGTTEIKGSRSNPVILSWVANLVQRGIDSIAWYRNDDTPWCGLFMGQVIAVTLPKEVIQPDLLRARSWLNFGYRVNPCMGSVLVFWRGSRRGSSGHVGIYVGEDSNYYFVIGGNQSNTVNIMKIRKTRLLAARWPNTASSIKTEPKYTSYKAAVSENEA